MTEIWSGINEITIDFNSFLLNKIKYNRIKNCTAKIAAIPRNGITQKPQSGMRLIII